MIYTNRLSMSSEPLIPKQSQARANFLVIRFSDANMDDLVLEISAIPFQDINTKWLRNMVRRMRPQQTTDRRVKFIRNGQPLNSHSDLHLQEFFNSSQGDRFYIHCIVGGVLIPTQRENEDALDDLGQQQDSTTFQAIGFDRLRSVGFSDEEIELLRRQFRATYEDFDENRDNQGDNNDIRQLEEQWIETGATDQNGQFDNLPISNYNYNKDLLIGLVVGCLLGVFSILLLKYGGLFSKRQKLGILVGLVFNVAFGVRNF